jgi:dTDP-glucose 4,6-dehydratase
MQLVVTGGAGFIGSNFVRYWLAEHPADTIVNIDKLTYAGNPANFEGLPAAQAARHTLVPLDICSPEVEQHMRGADMVIHFAAESHVDRSIDSAEEFIRTNVLGTERLLHAARKQKVGRFVHVSTDEVYGALGETGEFREDTPIAPNSPYAASKAGSDLVARSYFHTYGFPVVITRACNNYGPYQYPEKFIPLMTTNALENKRVPVYGKGAQVREWIHVEDHCRAIETVAAKGRPGEAYNIGSGARQTNFETVNMILALLGKPDSLIEYVADRPGHDFRYALDCSKLRNELGFAPKHNWTDGLRATVEWYKQNGAWVESVKNQSFRQYYSHMYEARDQFVQKAKS